MKHYIGLTAIAATIWVLSAQAGFTQDASTPAAPEAPKAATVTEEKDATAKVVDPDMQPIATPATKKSTSKTAMKKVVSDDESKSKSDKDSSSDKEKSSTKSTKSTKSAKTIKSAKSESSSKKTTAHKSNTSKSSNADQYANAPGMPGAAFAQQPMMMPQPTPVANSMFGSRAARPKFKLRKFQGAKEITDDQQMQPQQQMLPGQPMQYPGQPVNPAMQQYPPQPGAPQ